MVPGTGTTPAEATTASEDRQETRARRHLNHPASPIAFFRAFRAALLSYSDAMTADLGPG